MLEHLVMRRHRAVQAHEVLQQAPTTPAHLGRFAPDRDGRSIEIDESAADLAAPLHQGALSPEEGPHTRHELVDRERLDDVVIRTEIKRGADL
jgi:hypothetical protein